MRSGPNLHSDPDQSEENQTDVSPICDPITTNIQSTANPGHQRTSNGQYLWIKSTIWINRPLVMITVVNQIAGPLVQQSTFPFSLRKTKPWHCLREKNSNLDVLLNQLLQERSGLGTLQAVSGQIVDSLLILAHVLHIVVQAYQILLAL